MRAAQRYREPKLDIVVSLIWITLGSFLMLTQMERGFFSPNLLSERPPLIGSIGRAFSEGGWIRYREADSSYWQDPMQNPQDIRPGDSLFTGEDGKARVEYSNGHSVTLLPQTLVRFELKDRLRSFFEFIPNIVSPKFTLEKGGIEIELQNSSQSLNLSVAGRFYRIKSRSSRAHLEVRAPREPGEGVGFESGDNTDVQITRPGVFRSETLRLKPRQSALDGPNTGFRNRGFTMSPVSPADQDLIIRQIDPTNPSETDSVSIEFRWVSTARLSPSGTSKLEIEGVETKAWDVPNSVANWKANLLAGRYRWRVGGSDWKAFRVLPLLAPTSLGPVDGYVAVTHGKPDTEVRFSWKRIPQILRAEMELFGEPNSPGPRIFAAGPMGTDLTLKPGRYQWRVRSSYQNRETSGWSAPMHLDVTESSIAQILPKAPVPPKSPSKLRVSVQELKLLPIIDAEPVSVSTHAQSPSDLDRIRVTLRWRELKDLNHYAVTLLNAVGKRVFQKETRDHQLVFEISSLDSAEYRYQVEAFLNSGLHLSTPKIPVSIVFSPIALMQPTADEIKGQEKATLFTWRRTALTTAYRVQISESANFASTLLDQTTSNNFIYWRPNRPGACFWRVKGLSQSGGSRWSVARKVVFRVRR